MKIIVSGTYHIGSVDLVDKVIEKSGFMVTEVLNGGAPGIEEAALDWARIRGIPFTNFSVNRLRYSADQVIKDKHMISQAHGAIFIIRPFADLHERGEYCNFIITTVSCLGLPYYQYIFRPGDEDLERMFDGHKPIIDPHLLLTPLDKLIKGSHEVKEKEEPEPTLFG